MRFMQFILIVYLVQFSGNPLVRANAVKSRWFLTTELIELKANNYFVDKTEFIHDFLVNQPKYSYLTAPPRMGKTSLLTLIGLFCNATWLEIDGSVNIIEDDRKSIEFFENTTISKNETFFKTHRNKYSVIFVDFAPLRKTTTLDSFRVNMCSVIENMVNYYGFLGICTGAKETMKEFFKKYTPGSPYCSKNFKQALQDGSVFVRMLKEALGKEVIILGDAFDSILHAYLLNDITGSEAMAYFVEFVDGLLANEENVSVDRILFVGTLNLGGILSNFIKGITHREFYHDETIGKYFGLTEQEVKNLLRDFSLEDHFRIIDYWYNGFSVLDSHLKVFNISSVVSYVQRLKSQPIIPSESFSALIGLKPLFTDHRIGSTVTETLFGDGTRIRAPNDLNMTLLMGLKEKMKMVHLEEETRPENVTLANFKLITQEIDIFLRLLLDLGLISVAQDMGSSRMVKPPNRANSYVLRDYWYDSGYSFKYFNVSEKHQRLFTDAMTSFTTSNSSLQSLGEVLYNITSVKVPVKDSTFKALIYTYARRSAEQLASQGKEEVVVESGRTFCTSGSKAVERKTDIVLIWKSKKLGAILGLKKSPKRNGSLTAMEAFEQMKKLNYVDIFKTDPEYSKLHIQDMVLLGLSVSADGSLNIVGEASGSSGTAKMSFLRQKGKQRKAMLNRKFSSDRKPKDSVYDYNYN
nr:PREDICTED: uncharacterized protein LOC109039649 isoform X2 [Bemisia tabaci]